MECIPYKAGYKYQLKETCLMDVAIEPEEGTETDYLVLATGGILTVKKGYAWDGRLGPTVDTLNFVRGSLVHDGLYQLMREGHVGGGCHREAPDRLLRKLCTEDGVSARWA